MWLHGVRYISGFYFVVYKLRLTNLLQYFCFVYMDFDGYIAMFRVNVLLDRDSDAAGGGDIPGMTYIMLPCWSKISCI